MREHTHTHNSKVSLQTTIVAFCSLVFYALHIMSAHAYTMLSNFKVITTGVLSYLVLDKHVNKQAALSLALLFIGICVGQYATLNVSAEDTHQAGPASSWVHGALIMILVGILSAVASVYTEWVMNHNSLYRHESLNLQNMRLYTSGTVLNGLFCISTSTAALTPFADMQLIHWIIVLVYACMGLVTVRTRRKVGFGGAVRRSIPRNSAGNSQALAALCFSSAGLGRAVVKVIRCFRSQLSNACKACKAALELSPACCAVDRSS